MKENKIDELGKFIERFEELVEGLESYSNYLNLDNGTKRLRDDAIAILNKKVKKLKKAESIDEIKKVMRVNKYLEKRGLR